ncbi:MAG: SCO family protein [SAR324 cluster bacterium]|nr:SCO family protein [SAR324 cluster bacterium]
MKNNIQNDFRKKKLNLKIQLAVTLFVLGLPALVTADQKEFSSREKLKIYEDRGGDFTLPGYNGKKLSLADFRGKVVLLNFGYTYCPDVCPTILSQLKQTMLGLKNLSNQVQVLFVTLDPERDTPERLNEYLSFFHPSFLGLGGDSASIQTVAGQYKVRFYKETHPSIDGYFVAHTDYVYLIDQMGKYRGKYKTRWDQERMEDDIRQLIGN